MSAIDQARRARTVRDVRRSFVVGLGAAAVAVSMAAPASAGAPNHRGCLGEDIRLYAQDGYQFGALVSTVLADDGAGAEIQAHLAGLVVDSTIPNSCND